MSIGEVEKQIRESAPLSDRLTDCEDRIGKMCSEGRPPKMSIPAQWNDDDLFICTTLSDAQAVERELAMKQDDWLKECQENDRLRAALAAAQGEVESMKKSSFVPAQPNSAYYMNYQPKSQTSIVDFQSKSSIHPNSIPNLLAQKMLVRTPHSEADE